jgi:4-diphosphocytidyl-2-C-methyl-D-erythritol kinase
MSLAESWGYLDEVRVRVPAKINLALCVGRRRQDGYHELATLFQAVSLYDQVTAISAEDGVSCEMRGTEAHLVGPGAQNLAHRAAELIRREYGVTDGVHIEIEKRIPVAGGMAGGSADAAGALLACSQLWDLGASTSDLIQLASQLGADVPFALMGGCAVGLGRGETLTPALSRGQFHWVLAFATRGLSTPDVYQRFDELHLNGDLAPIPELPGALMMALTSGDTRRIAKVLINDLQPAACSLTPGLHVTLAAGRDAGCLGAIVSGSGPTIAFLAADHESALNLAVALSDLGVARAVQLVTGPVPGATIIAE